MIQVLIYYCLFNDSILAKGTSYTYCLEHLMNALPTVHRRDAILGLLRICMHKGHVLTT